jgi:membrane protein
MAAANRGRGADRPRKLGVRGWVDVAYRVKDRVKSHHMGIIAGGVAFYGFLAIFPAIAALISIYGLVSDPAQVEEQLMALGGVLPDDVLAILQEQMGRVVATSGTALGGGAIVSLGLALWSARRGMRSLIEALNVAYAEEERRGLVRRYGLTLVFTLGAVLAVVLAVAIVVALPSLLGLLGLDAFARGAVAVLRWPLLAALLLAGLAVVYRYGPSREDAKWRWVTPGAALATVLWILGSLGLSAYVENFGAFHETYGALGAVAILLLWFFLSAFVVLLGAEVNAEAERQTRKDSTTGQPQQMGDRGAFAADTLGESRA